MKQPENKRERMFFNLWNAQVFFVKMATWQEKKEEKTDAVCLYASCEINETIRLYNQIQQ